MKEFPYFSIVIPTYNRPDRLEKCLQSIAQLSYPHDRFEVIAVDDGSDISIEPIVDKFREQFSLAVIRQNNAGPASARNLGAAVAKGDYLAFTDDDCQPDPDWLSSLAQATIEVPHALIGGYTANALPENIFSTASQLLIDYLYSYYNHSHNQSAFFASNNFSVPRDLYQKLGGFDTSFPLAAGEDREFCDRWNYHGHSTYFAKNAKVLHAHHLKLPTFWRQHSNYGRGAYYFHLIHAARKFKKIKIEPVQFYWNLMVFPFSQKTEHAAVLIAVLFFVSQLANVLGFFRESFSSKAVKLIAGVAPADGLQNRT